MAQSTVGNENLPHSYHSLFQIPFYTERITQEAINRGKRVLITSHENALRGILMHLCNIPEVNFVAGFGSSLAKRHSRFS
jgi:bisphosphoglycerate-dependent phosphoglycerate mutase